MRKLIQGIVAFRNTARPGYRETFRRLALEQKPDCLFIACSDSRVVPNLFASTEPGDLFVTRNVGNLVPPAGPGGISTGDEAEAGAIEYAVRALDVQDIVVCGHSSCGAMSALMQAAGYGEPKAGLPSGEAPNLSRWLRHALPALADLREGKAPETPLALGDQDVLSLLNVLQQVEHVKSYPAVAERIQAGELSVHGWWFDIEHADVYAYDAEAGRFVRIDETTAPRLMERYPK